MKSNTYKNYRKCPICGGIYPLTRDYFARVNGKHREESFHYICRNCENIIKYNKEWKDGMLLCHSCYRYLPENDFSCNGGESIVRNKRRYICRECYKKHQQERNKNLDDQKRLLKILKWRFLGARDRAKRHNIEFSITEKDLIELWKEQEGLCALTKIPMTYTLQEGRNNTNISIDRIDSTKGYIKDNIQLVCMAVNQMKSDLTMPELVFFCKNIIDNYENKNNKKSI